MRRLDSALSATLTGLVDRYRGAGSTRQLGDERLDGKTCLVTGASRGLGSAVARQLARRGASLILPCRSDHEATRRGVAAEGDGEVSTPDVDLSDLRSIRSLADRLRDEQVRIDVAVMNAGIVTRSARKSAQGFEMMTAVNYIATAALLTRLLEDGVIDNATFTSRPKVNEGTARIVVVTSEAHRSAGPIRPAALGRFVPFGATDAVARYGESKLLLTSMAMELSRRLGDRGVVDVAVHALCPGAVDTHIAREAPAWLKPVLFPVMRALFRSPEAAAAPCVYLSTAAAIAGETGLYLHHMTDKRPSAHALDPERGRELWDATQRLLRSF
jgi:NAD(P)-dependent dehydrogenase (short-subunit alcohol dehydrogenase family)